MLKPSRKLAKPLPTLFAAMLFGSSVVAEVIGLRQFAHVAREATEQVVTPADGVVDARRNRIAATVARALIVEEEERAVASVVERGTPVRSDAEAADLSASRGAHREAPDASLRRLPRNDTKSKRVRDPCHFVDKIVTWF